MPVTDHWSFSLMSWTDAVIVLAVKCDCCSWSTDALDAKMIPPLVPLAGRYMKLSSYSCPSTFSMVEWETEASFVSCRQTKSGLYMLITCFTSSCLADPFKPRTFQVMSLYWYGRLSIRRGITAVHAYSLHVGRCHKHAPAYWTTFMIQAPGMHSLVRDPLKSYKLNKFTEAHIRVQ